MGFLTLWNFQILKSSQSMGEDVSMTLSIQNNKSISVCQADGWLLIKTRSWQPASYSKHINFEDSCPYCWKLWPRFWVGLCPHALLYGTQLSPCTSTAFPDLESSGRIVYCTPATFPWSEWAEAWLFLPHNVPCSAEPAQGSGDSDFATGSRLVAKLYPLDSTLS